MILVTWLIGESEYQCLNWITNHLRLILFPVQTSYIHGLHRIFVWVPPNYIFIRFIRYKIYYRNNWLFHESDRPT